MCKTRRREARAWHTFTYLIQCIQRVLSCSVLQVVDGGFENGASLPLKQSIFYPYYYPLTLSGLGRLSQGSLSALSLRSLSVPHHYTLLVHHTRDGASEPREHAGPGVLPADRGELRWREDQPGAVRLARVRGDADVRHVRPAARRSR